MQDDASFGADATRLEASRESDVWNLVVPVILKPGDAKKRRAEAFANDVGNAHAKGYARVRLSTIFSTTLSCSSILVRLSTKNFYNCPASSPSSNCSAVAKWFPRLAPSQK